MVVQGMSPVHYLVLLAVQGERRLNPHRQYKRTMVPGERYPLSHTLYFWWASAKARCGSKFSPPGTIYRSPLAILSEWIKSRCSFVKDSVANPDHNRWQYTDTVLGTSIPGLIFRSHRHTDGKEGVPVRKGLRLNQERHINRPNTNAHNT
jgi:hypothetical protein